MKCKDAVINSLKCSFKIEGKYDFELKHSTKLHFLTIRMIKCIKVVHDTHKRSSVNNSYTH